MSLFSRSVVPLLVVLVAVPALAQRPKVERAVESFEIGALTAVQGERTGPFPVPPALRHVVGMYFASWKEGVPIPFTDEFEDSERGQPAFVDLIRNLIDEDSWSNQRNQIDRIGDHLVVAQTKDVIDRVRQFLTVLERRSERRYRLEVAFVPPSALAVGDGPWLENGAFDRVLAAGAGQSVLLSGLYRAGTTRMMMSGGTEMRFVDLEVNQTGVMPTLTATVGMMPRGFFALARVAPGPNPEWCRLDLDVVDASISNEMKKRRVLGSDLELLTHSGEYFGTSLVVLLDRAMLVGYFDARAPEGDDASTVGPESVAVIVRLRAIGGGDTEKPRGDVPAVIESGLLVAALPDRRVGSSFRGPEELAYDNYSSIHIDDDDLPRFVEREFLVEYADGLLPEAEQGEGRVQHHDEALFVDADDATVKRVRDGLKRLVRSRVRLVDIELWQVSVAKSESGELSRAGSVLEAGWATALANDIETRARVVGFHDMNLYVTAARSTSGVRDVEMVSGGTETSQTVAADPTVATIGAGLELQVNASLVPGTAWAQLSVRGEAARPPTTKRQSRVRANNDVEIGKGEKDLAATGSMIDLDLTDEDSDLWQHLVTVPLGRAMVLNVLPDRARPDRVRALVARVKAYSYDGVAEKDF
jgi:hypothetical protein